MQNALLFVLLLIYFWYFYHTDSKALSPPQTAGPEPATPFNLTYNRLGDDEFEVRENGTFVWSEKVPSYFVSAAKDGIQIQEIDACHQSIQDNQTIPAKGLSLYNFVKKYPKFKSLVETHKNEEGYISRQGTPFYFTCHGKRISALTLCPPGRIFQNGGCQPISSCTGQRDNITLPHPDPHYWIQCRGGEEHVQQCAPGHVFYAGKCTKETESLCVLQRDLPFFKFDDFTLFGCQNHTPIYKSCPPGTRLFDSTLCEPSDCVGKADGTRIPLRKRKRTPFEYSPGYMTCRQGKIAKTVECPQIWDPSLAGKENLTMLPMVFDTASQTCSPPSLCKNVWPTEPDVYVQAYDYTRNLQNWFYAKFYDQGHGYRCDPNDPNYPKIEAATPVNQRINHHFKVVPICNENDPKLLPLYQRIQGFYDCNQNAYDDCQGLNQFFNGETCLPKPTYHEDGPVFMYDNYMPLFQFDSLSSDGWIQPFTKIFELDPVCEPGYQLIKPYTICSHPLCTPFAFLSMIPELSLLLPPNIEKSKCRYDEATKHLRKLPLPPTLNYTFWDQKIRHEKESIKTETCVLSQHLQTGNFVWDKTLYATCNHEQPFVFCPSVDTQKITAEVNHDGTHTFVCAPPPDDKMLRHDKNLSIHTQYPKNQFKRVWRKDPNLSTSIILNKSDTYKYMTEVPVEGLEIPDNERVNIKSLHPVDLEYKWRMTFPPNVAYTYTIDQGKTKREIHIADNPSKVFNLTSQQFEYGKFKFPKYSVKSFVNQFNVTYDP